MKIQLIWNCIESSWSGSGTIEKRGKEIFWGLQQTEEIGTKKELLVMCNGILIVYKNRP